MEAKIENKRILIDGQNAIIVNKDLNSKLPAISIHNPKGIQVEISGFTIHGGNTLRGKIEFLMRELGYKKWLVRLIKFLLFVFDYKLHKARYKETNSYDQFFLIITMLLCTVAIWFIKQDPVILHIWIFLIVFVPLIGFFLVQWIRKPEY